MNPIFSGQPAKLSEADARTIERLSNRNNKRMQSYEPTNGMFTVAIKNKTSEQILKGSAVCYNFNSELFNIQKYRNPYDDPTLLQFNTRSVVELYPQTEGVEGNYRDHCGQCGVLLDTLRPDSVGRLQISGFCWAYVYLEYDYTQTNSNRFHIMALRPMRINEKAESKTSFSGRIIPFLFADADTTTTIRKSGQAHVIHPTKAKIMLSEGGVYQRFIPAGLQLMKVDIGTSRYNSWVENLMGYNE